MLRFGIVGTNFISDWFAEAVTIRSDATVAAVYSRTAESGEEFAHRHGTPMATTRYEALLDAVDAVYIASPIIAHHPQALAAPAAGRHVLVEKTMAGSAAQTAEIQDAAAASGLIVKQHQWRTAVQVIAAIDPQVSPLGGAAPRLELRHRRFIGMQHAALSQVEGEAVGQRLQGHAAAADPLGQG